MLCRPEHMHIHRRVSRGKSITLSRKSTTINTLLKAGAHEVTVTCWPTAVKKLNKRRQAAVFSSVKGEGDFDVFRPRRGDALHRWGEVLLSCSSLFCHTKIILYSLHVFDVRCRVILSDVGRHALVGHQHRLVFPGLNCPFTVRLLTATMSTFF